MESVSSSAAREWHRRAAHGGAMQSINEQPSRSADNYYKVLQEESESRSEENEEELYEEEMTSGSSFSPTISKVYSTKYSEDDGFFKDDEAFFERLAEMTARIDVKSGTDEDTPIKSDVERDREATDANVGLRRSSCTIRAPRRLIEESGVSVDKREPDWRDRSIKMYETTLKANWRCKEKSNVCWLCSVQYWGHLPDVHARDQQHS
jgi:hypothetical protein